MPRYALVNGELAAAHKLGMRATCVDPACNWQMVAKPGNGRTAAHWAHMPGAVCQYDRHDTEKGEWHCEVQNVFSHFGAHKEVVMRSIDGTKDHRADVVLGDGRIIEAQTRYLKPEEVVSRENTYGTMAWLYDAGGPGDFLIADDNDPSRFRWAKVNRRFLTHRKPVFLDCHLGGIWQLERLTLIADRDTGRRLWDGRRRKVADDLHQFVIDITMGGAFGAAPRFPAIDPTRSKAGTRTVPHVDPQEWLADNKHCSYEPSTSIGDPTVIVYDTVLPALQRAGIRMIDGPAEQTADAATRQKILAAGIDNFDLRLVSARLCSCDDGCSDVHFGDNECCAPSCRRCRILAGLPVELLHLKAPAA
jgi:hypothetical protein